METLLVYAATNPEAVIAEVVALCALISAIFPSVGKIMKVVDLLAFNWGKARNDARVQ